MQWFPNQNVSIKRVISYTLSFGLLVAPIAEAAYKPGGQKPVPKDRRSDAGTTRGCSGGDSSLTVLASRNYIGRATKQHPTFAWVVPADSASKPTRFAIYEWVLGGKPKAIRTLSLQSTVGVMKLSPFAENEPGLQPGKQYLWQVVIQCDLDNPSGDLVSQTSLEVVAMPASLQSKLSRAANSAERSNLYAEAGFWYDALGEALKQAEASKLGTLGAELLNDLAQSEVPRPELSPKERSAIEKQIATLKQIAASTRWSLNVNKQQQFGLSPEANFPKSFATSRPKRSRILRRLLGIGRCSELEILIVKNDITQNMNG